MPRKFSPLDKIKWLRLSEDGKTDKSIARDAGCDVRTVKRGIEEARRQGDARMARAELLKDALQRHQNALLAVVDDAFAHMAGLPIDLQLPEAEEAEPTHIKLPGVTMGYDRNKGWTVTLDAENKPEWQLLREHTRHDAMWGAIDRWKRALLADLEARIALKKKAAQLLVERTEYKGSGEKRVFLLNAGVDFVYKRVLSQALKIDRASGPEDLLESSPSGAVEDGSGKMLAYSPGFEKELRGKIRGALKALRQSSEAARASETCEGALESLIKAKQTLQEVSMLRLIPGQCRVCRRLGM